MATLILCNHWLVKLLSTLNKGQLLGFDFVRRWKELWEERKRVCGPTRWWLAWRMLRLSVGVGILVCDWMCPLKLWTHPFCCRHKPLAWEDGQSCRDSQTRSCQTGCQSGYSTSNVWRCQLLFSYLNALNSHFLLKGYFWIVWLCIVLILVVSCQNFHPHFRILSFGLFYIKNHNLTLIFCF